MPGELQYLALVPQQPELSRILRLEDITNAANTLVIDANTYECARLAERFDVPYLRNLSAEITHRRTRGGHMIRIDGRITANYSQLCSATLMPMPMTMEETFQTEYTLVPWEKYSEFDLDQPEVLSDDFLDIGEVAAQYFGLAIDPYARRAGQETLAELVDDISKAVAEMVGQADEAVALLVNQAEPEPQIFDDIAEVVEILPPASAAPQAEVIHLIMPPETMDLAVPPQPESPFFRYLRQIRES